MVMGEEEEDKAEEGEEGEEGEGEGQRDGMWNSEGCGAKIDDVK